LSETGKPKKFFSPDDGIVRPWFVFDFVVRSIDLQNGIGRREVLCEPSVDVHEIARG